MKLSVIGRKRACIKERLTKSYRQLADQSEKSDFFVVCQEKSGNTRNAQDSDKN